MLFICHLVQIISEMTVDDYWICKLRLESGDQDVCSFLQGELVKVAAECSQQPLLYAKVEL